MTGMTFYANGKDFFYATEVKKKHKGIVEEIAKVFLLHMNDRRPITKQMLEDMKDKLSPVTLEKREYPYGVRYNLIGDSSSVYNLKIDEDLVIL